MIVTRTAPLLLLLLLLAQVCAGRPRLRHRSAAPGCSRCAPGWGALSPCAPLLGRDTRCQRCARGHAYSPHHSARAPCWLCSRCGPGLFEARACSPRRDTVCDACDRVRALRGKGDARPPPADFYRRCNASDSAL